MYGDYDKGRNTTSLFSMIIIAIVVIAGIVGNIYTYQTLSSEVKELTNEVETLQAQISSLFAAFESSNLTILGNLSLSGLYERVKDSVVLIHGYVVEGFGPFQQISEVSGSGFVYNFSGQMVVTTNFHVVQDAESLTVSLASGNSYPASVLGSDPYVDLAILSVDNSEEELCSLAIASSSSLEVGDSVIAVGNPYGLTGTVTTGIVSQLGRTITEPMTGGYPIADVIQISTPINPGNSGGPLLNSKGQVVGITTAIISESQGIGFAIPSDTLLREISWLVDGLEYKHSWLGVTGMDVTFEIAEVMETNTTYGWLVVEVSGGSPAYEAGLMGASRDVEIFGQMIPVDGDIILSVNGTMILGGDTLSSYIERYTRPGQTIAIKVERSKVEVSVFLVLGARPPPA